MSISITSSASTSASQTSGQQQGIRSYIKQLGQALQTGDLSAAQQAYSALSQLPQFVNAQNTQSGSGQGTFVQALTQVGSDLQSGNLPAAQQAFSAAQSQGQANTADPTKTGGHHHHHHAAQSSDASSSTSDTSDSSSTDSGSSINDQILAMLTNIENTLLSMGTDNQGGTAGANGTIANTATTSALVNDPVNILA